jgi:hypothetical protein
MLFAQVDTAEHGADLRRSPPSTACGAHTTRIQHRRWS